MLGCLGLVLLRRRAGLLESGSDRESGASLWSFLRNNLDNAFDARTSDNPLV